MYLSCRNQFIKFSKYHRSEKLCISNNWFAHCKSPRLIKHNTVHLQKTYDDLNFYDMALREAQLRSFGAYLLCAFQSLPAFNQDTSRSTNSCANHDSSWSSKTKGTGASYDHYRYTKLKGKLKAIHRRWNPGFRIAVVLPSKKPGKPSG